MLNVLACHLGASMDPIIPKFITAAIRVFQIAIPIILVVLGMIDLGKAVTSNDEKQMKEAQKTLIKRVIYAILIFFIVALVKFVFGLLADASKDVEGQSSNQSSNKSGSASACINCFLNYEDGCLSK